MRGNEEKTEKDADGDEWQGCDDESPEKPAGATPSALLPQDVLDAVAEAHAHESDSENEDEDEDEEERQRRAKKQRTQSKAPAPKPRRIRFADHGHPPDLTVNGGSVTVSVLRRRGAEGARLPPRAGSDRTGAIRKNLLRGRAEMARLGAAGKGRRVVRGRMVRRPFGARAREGF